MSELRVDVDDDDFEFDEDQSATYRGELLTGVLFECWPNGVLANEVGYLDGKAYGSSRFWYDDGAPESEATLGRTGPIGVTRGWHRNGVLARETTYEDGKEVGSRQWDEDGRFIVPKPTTRPFPIPDTAEDRAELEQRLRRRIRPDGQIPDPLYHVAGIEVRYTEDTISAVVAVTDIESSKTVETAGFRRPLKEGTPTDSLGFQEIYTALAALGKLTTAPGVITCVGDGPSHPVDFNFATHLGVRTGTPTLGVSGEAYLGTYAEPGPERGDQSDLVDGGTVIGRAVRTQVGQPPVFVTQGQRLGLDAAVELTLRLTENGGRLPASTVAAAAAVLDADEDA
ncbi:MAG TPA: endonuclease V [Actinospica sp.]|jgi:deoxyribonuclease V|nr:endonuclease V [Actinospica sp.]